jgi:peptidyl-prolyl cis-trans isomerase SurA
MFRPWSLALTVALPLLVTLPARATIVERVVAVVGEQPILLSEVKSRTAPFEAQIGGAAAERAAQRSQLFEQMLNRMIDEELLRRAASQAKVTVTDAEIDAAVERVASSNNVTVDELLAEVERSGVNVVQYRRELRSQLLDAKVMNTRLQGRVSVSPEDTHDEYQALVGEERKTLPVRLQALRIEVPSSAPAAEAARLAALAQSVAQKARGGAPFETLVRQYSSSPEDRNAGGALPEVSPSQMPKDIATVVLALEPGQVSEPVFSQGTWVVLKLLSRAPSQLPSYEQAEMQLVQRVQMRKMEKVRRRWLDDMRKRSHVEVRL